MLARGSGFLSTCRAFLRSSLGSRTRMCVLAAVWFISVSLGVAGSDFLPGDKASSSKPRQSSSKTSQKNQHQSLEAILRNNGKTPTKGSYQEPTAPWERIMRLRRTYTVSALFIGGMLSTALQHAAQAQTLAPPTGLTAAAVSGPQVNLAWQDNSSNEHEFGVFRRPRYSRKSFVLMGVTLANVSTFQDKTVEPNTEYSYKVAARQWAKGKTNYSDYSNIVDVRTAGGSTNQVVLPIEVMGPDGTVVSSQVYVGPYQAAAPNALWLKIHGASYPDKISVQVNNGAWVNLNNTTANVEEPGKKYGGIGGAFASLKMTVPLTEPLVAGTNTVRFRFNRTDGVSMGFRVLGFNFVNTTVGANAISASSFVDENPDSWAPPLGDDASIAAGEKLWRTGALINSPINKSAIKATCADCHAQDGRDLKYFNFSNFSIIERSKFHGLSELQGAQIASYIRTRPIINPGRPWNPPYQPGPGVDSKPILAWSAGAGLDWTLDGDLETFDYLFPNGINKASVATTGKLNVREIPVSLQLPDWNRWLPRIHPKDAWGDSWVNSEILKRYNGDGGSSYTGPTLRQRFSDKANLATYLGSKMSKAEINTWQLRRYEFLAPRTEGTGITWTPTHSEAVYSTALWQGVKMWEMVHEFDLQGYGSVYYGSAAENRTWFSAITFMSSPFMLKIKSDANGIGGSAVTNEYFSNAWYYTQLILNPGNGVPGGSDPVDWGYVWGKFYDMYRLNGSAELGRYAVYFVKGMQEWDNPNGLSWPFGWHPLVVPVSVFVHPAVNKMWAASGIPSDRKARILEALLGAWLDKSMQFSADAYYSQNLASPTYVPVVTNGYDGTFGDRLWYMIPAFRTAGVDETLLGTATNWGASIFPAAPWASLTSTSTLSPP
jgi:hypothetical protein